MHTQNDVDNANMILEFLVENIDTDVDGIMQAKLNQSEYETNTSRLEENLAQAGRDAPVGAIAAGTGFVKNQVEITGEEGQSAIRILKDTNRLQQCGRGRGVVLIILSDLPVTADELKVDEKEIGTEVEPIPATKVEQTLNTVVQQHNKVIEQRDRALKLIEERDEELRELRQKVEELQSKMDNLQVTTWS